MDITKNSFLKDIMKHIKVVSNNSSNYFTKILKDQEIPLKYFDNKNFFIDWDKVTPSFEFFYDYEGCENEISKLLANSKLSKESKIIILISIDEPIIEVDTKVFINNWYSFFAASGYMGIVAISKSKKFYFELVDSDFNFYSNFTIKL